LRPVSGVEEVGVSACARLPRRFSRGVAVALFAGLIGVCLGGVASAYWGSVGNGQSSAATTTAAPVVVSPGAPAATLYPGGMADIALTVSNPNAFSVHIDFLTLDVSRGTAGFTVDAGHPGCDASALTFPTQTNGDAGWTIPAKVGAVNGSLALTLANALNMNLGAADACQGAVFAVAMAAGP
jgi:hypothetical protein